VGDDFITAADLQKRYHISHVTLWRWLRNSQLEFPKPTTIGRLRLWRRADVVAWESNHQGAAA
jgi:predicted DNA-binding transcriptional regulator AlpA